MFPGSRAKVFDFDSDSAGQLISLALHCSSLLLHKTTGDSCNIQLTFIKHVKHVKHVKHIKHPRLKSAPLCSIGVAGVGKHCVLERQVPGTTRQPDKLWHQ